VETGLVIGGHYLLQHLIKQGQFSTVYQGVDQLFQRNVAVKSVPAAQIPAYRAAVRMTSQFSYPNIIGLYDLVAKPDRLYLIQEYVEGEDFAALLQAPLLAHEVTDIGRQVCQAVLYAGSLSRGVCHGDLTTGAIIRDRRGLIRLGNFALPSDIAYFTAWNKLGGEGAVLADRELPWGVPSEGRQSDDVRATGLLLYQLLTSRAPSATTVEPPADGLLRFPRNVPPELCELIARTVIRQHPQRITRMEALYDELKTLTEALEARAPILVSSPAVPRPPDVARGGQVQSPAPETPGNLLPAGQAGSRLAAYRSENSGKLAAMEMEPVNSALTIADATATPLMPLASRQAVYPGLEVTPPQSASYSQAASPRRSPLLWLLVLGLVVFALCFAIGFFAGGAIFPR
jgi:eukaryotic-like serine/threonine-protein kinase